MWNVDGCPFSAEGGVSRRGFLGTGGAVFAKVLAGRHLQRATADALSVKDSPFGARGDGKADDSKPIQRALDVARLANGRTVYLPTGVYLVGSLLSVGRNVVVHCAPGVNIKLSGAGALSLGSGSALLGATYGFPSSPDVGTLIKAVGEGVSAVTIRSGSIGAVIENVGFDGGGRRYTLRPAIDFATGAGVSNRNYVRNLSVVNWRGVGIALGRDTTDNHFDNVTMSDCGDENKHSPAIDLADNTNSNMFINVQLDSSRFAGVRDGSGRGGGNLFVNLKIDTNAAPPGSLCFLVAAPTTLLRVSNFAFRADQSVGRTGDCIRIDAPATDLAFINGYCVRFERATGVAINVNDARARRIHVANVHVRNFAVGLRDTTEENQNSYAQLSFEGCAIDVSLTQRQPITLATSSGKAEERVYTLTVGDAICGDRSADDNLVFRTKKPGAGWVVFADEAGAPRASISGSTGDVNTSGVFRKGGTQVVGPRAAAVSDATGGSVVDAEARTAINALLARIRAHGLIES